MDRLRRLILGSAVASAFGWSPRGAEAADWVLIGESNVNLLKNITVVAVTVREGLFSHIRLDVAEERVVIEALEVTFSNGATAALDVRSTIRAGGQSRPILLPGVVRAIRTIKIQHKRIPTGGTAIVRIYGRNL